MAPEPYHDKVYEDEDGIDLDPQPPKQITSRWSWERQSFFVRTLIVVGYTILIVALSSVFIEYRAPATTTTTSTSTPATHQEAEHEAEHKAEVVTATTSSSVAAAPSATSSLSEIKFCGHNAAEARSLGCVYDVMMQLWMHEDCYDGPLTESFLAIGNWTWWSDEAATHIMTDEEMRAGEHSVAFMLQDYHKHHCVFAMEKLVRALRNKSPLISELVSYDHIVHCRHKTLFRPDVVRGVRAPTGFTGCAPYSVWVNHLPQDEHSSTE